MHEDKAGSEGHAVGECYHGNDVPLVRTEGKKYLNGWAFSIDHVLDDPILRVESRDAIAREAEIAFHLGPSLYFYVGHACHDFAADAACFVLVFEAVAFDGGPASATPFDTGGMFKEYIHFDVGAQPPVLPDYVRQQMVPQAQFSTWRERFRAYLIRHFASSQAYVLGQRATRSDPEGRLLHPRNERRAWTWEIQVQRDHDLREGLRRLWMTQIHRRRLAQKIRAIDDPVNRARWMQTLLLVKSPSHEESPFAICRGAEQEIATWL